MNKKTKYIISEDEYKPILCKLIGISEKEEITITKDHWHNNLIIKIKHNNGEK